MFRRVHGNKADTSLLSSFGIKSRSFNKLKDKKVGLTPCICFLLFLGCAIGLLIVIIFNAYFFPFVPELLRGHGNKLSDGQAQNEVVVEKTVAEKSATVEQTPISQERLMPPQEAVGATGQEPKQAPQPSNEKSSDGYSQGDAHPLSSEVSTSPERPTHYRMACGRSGSFYAFECIQGQLAFNNFTGDKDIAGLKIPDRTSEVLFPKKQCSPLCASERSAENFGYHLPIQNGSYSVRISVTECFFHEPGRRNFSVLIENKPVLWIDVFSETRSLEKVFVTPYLDTKVEDGVLDIQFVSEKDNALCNSIEVIPTAEVEAVIAPPRAPSSQFLFCSTEAKENVRIEGPNNADLPISLLQNTAGNINIYGVELNGSGVHKLVEKFESKSRQVFSRHLQSSDCICLREIQQLSCPSKYSRVASSLFKKWQTKKVTEVKFLGENARSKQEALHCSIVSNRLYCEPVPASHSDWLPFQTLILTVLRSVKIPNMEFYFDSSQQSATESSADSPPVFGVFYSEYSANIPVPSALLTIAALDGKVLLNATKSKPWQSKKDSAYSLMEYSGRNGSKWFESVINSVGEASNSVLVESRGEALKAMSDHKLVVRTGNGTTPLLPVFDVLSSGTVLVQPKVRQFEWIDLFLEAGKNCVEVEDGKQTVAEMVKTTLTNKEHLRALSEGSLAFSLSHFQSSSVVCWTAFVLSEYQRTLAFEAQVRTGMVELTQANKTCDRC